jgi:hypothetical protein
MEAEVLAQIQTGKTYFAQFDDAPHWLAAHRLKAKGVLKESPVANCFEIA